MLKRMSVSEKMICGNGCGFYGCNENHSLCSGCYNNCVWEKNSIMLADVPGMLPLLEVIDEANQGPPLARSSNKVTSMVQDSQYHTSHDFPMLSIDSSSTKSTTKVQPSCKVCEKHVGLLGFPRQHCEDVFCGSHRHMEDHACSVNYKSIGCHALAEQNPVVKIDKLGSRG